MVGRVVFQPVDQYIPEDLPVLRAARVLLVAADVPDVPFACERERLPLRQRLPLAPLRGTDCRDPGLDFGGPFADADLRVLWPRAGRHRELCFPTGAVQPLVLGANVLRDAFAYCDRAGLGASGCGHAE
jgi:hypothetical protein